MNAIPWFNQPKTTQLEATDELPAQNETNAPLAIALGSCVQMLMDSPAETKRRQNMLFDLELYLGQSVGSLYDLDIGDYTRPANDKQGPNAEPDLVTNVVYGIVSTIQNRICSFRPRAQFVPSGGDFRARRLARDMTTMSDAWAEEQNLQEEMALAFRDLLSMTGGCAAVKVYPEGDKIECARFPPWEFIFDQAEGVHRRPECLYHVQDLTIEQVARRFDLEETDLRHSALASNARKSISYTTDRVLVRVVEAWHRGPDGRHVILVGDRIVLDEEWEYDGWPVVFKAFEPGVIGTWGPSAVFPIRSLQTEMNEVMNGLREAHRASSSQVWLIQDSETNAPTNITNAYVRIMRYTNTPPTVVNPEAVPAGRYKYREELKKDMYETIGVSPFAAQGVKQAGVTSAVAIRESSEMQTDRLALLSQVWEKMRTEIANWWRRLTRDLIRDNPEAAPKFRGIQRGSWRDLDFKSLDGDYEIRALPSSIFGQTISGRLERAVELIKSGWITKEDAMKALDVPDLEPIIDVALAESYYMEKIVDDILESEDPARGYVTPDPYVDPSKMYAYARARYLLAMSEGLNYPDVNLSNLRRLIDAVKSAADEAEKAQPPAPGGPGGAGGPPPEEALPDAGTLSAMAGPAGQPPTQPQ